MGRYFSLGLSSNTGLLHIVVVISILELLPVPHEDLQEAKIITSISFIMQVRALTRFVDWYKFVISERRTFTEEDSQERRKCGACRSAWTTSNEHSYSNAIRSE